MRPAPVDPRLVEEAHRKQAAYHLSRLAWADAIGRPYLKRRLRRPPPPARLDLVDHEDG